MSRMNKEEMRRLFELLVKASSQSIFTPTEMMSIWATRDAVEAQLTQQPQENI